MIDLTSIEERAKAATPGPWFVDPDPREGMEYNTHICACDDLRICFMANGGGNEARQAECAANAELIAAAREDIPALMAEIRRLRAQAGWRTIDIPSVKVGSLGTFLILTQNKDGKRHVIPAYYLNACRLEYEEPCDKHGCNGEHDDNGCPTTGWFYDESNFEYDNCYHPIRAEVLAHAPLPSVQSVEAMLAAAPPPDGEGMK